MRVLIVEDDFISRKILNNFLRDYGECDVAVNGEEGLKAITEAVKAEKHYDLIRLDIKMPGIDGIQTLGLLRALEEESGVSLGEGAKILMTTSVSDRTEIVKAFRDNCDGYLRKPIAKKKLVESLEKLGFIPATAK